jgi:hypothetical protein
VLDVRLYNYSYVPFVAPKGPKFTQPRATPWEQEIAQFFFGPTGQPFSSAKGEFLARWADHIATKY